MGVWRCCGIAWKRRRHEFALGLQNTLHGFGSQRADELLLEIGHARKEPERFKGFVRGNRNGRAGECAANVSLLGEVIHTAKLCIWMHPHEARERLGEVRYAAGGADLDVKQTQVAAKDGGKRANSGSIAVSLHEHECTNLSHDSRAPRGREQPQARSRCALPRQAAH
jgi:hypothetical protein